MKHLFSILVAILFHSCLNAAPAEILIIRDAEKTTSGASLSTKGKERAAALVPFFMETQELLSSGMPVAIYAAGTSATEPFSYAIETVRPLADKLNLTIKINYIKSDFKKMVDEIKNDSTYNGKTVLICWDKDTIPDIARAFGALQTPSKWPHDSYDRVWVIKFSSTGKPNAQNLPQRLLFGDSKN